MLCPSDIELILHCHTCPSPHPRFDAPTIQKGLKKFLEAEVNHPTLKQLGLFREKQGQLVDQETNKRGEYVSKR